MLTSPQPGAMPAIDLENWAHDMHELQADFLCKGAESDAGGPMGRNTLLPLQSVMKRWPKRALPMLAFSQSGERAAATLEGSAVTCMSRLSDALVTRQSIGCPTSAL